MLQAFKHLLRNANFHVYCDHSALVHILKAKRELPTLRLKRIEDIIVLTGGLVTPMQIIQIAAKLV